MWGHLIHVSSFVLIDECFVIDLQFFVWIHRDLFFFLNLKEKMRVLKKGGRKENENPIFFFFFIYFYLPLHHQYKSIFS